MKKPIQALLSLLLCAVLCAGAVSGCAAPDADADAGTDSLTETDDTDGGSTIFTPDEISDILDSLPTLPPSGGTETDGNPSSDGGNPSTGGTVQTPVTVRNDCIDDSVSYAAVLSAHAEITKLLSSLTINGVTCAFEEKTATYCLSISESAVGQLQNWPIEAKSDRGDVHLSFENGTISSDGKFTPKANQTLKFRAYTDALYANYQLRISIVPVLTVETEKRAAVTSKTKDIFCTVTLQDPDSAAHSAAALFSSYATIHVRGNTSASYEKKPYKIELQKFVNDASGNTVMTERNASLLGMRSDDDWTLDGLYLDPTLMHNKMAYDLWQETGAVSYPYGISNGPKCRYVEVILNGSYNGLYLLVEPVDEKQTGVEKAENTKDGSHGTLIKTTSWTYVKFDTYSGSPYNESTKQWLSVWGGFEMKYPETSVTAADWAPVTDLMAACVDGTDAQFNQTAERLLDRQNVVDFWIFGSVLLARDNAGKNVVWSVPNLSKSNYKAYLCVWDCDNTFGYRYGKPAIKENPVKTENYMSTWFKLLRRYLTNNVSGSADYLQTRWAELSAQGAAFSAQSLCDRVDRTADYLAASGAYEREQQRWSASCPTDLETERAYTKQWITKRIPAVNDLVRAYKK